LFAEDKILGSGNVLDVINNYDFNSPVKNEQKSTGQNVTEGWLVENTIFSNFK